MSKPGIVKTPDSYIKIEEIPFPYEPGYQFYDTASHAFIEHQKGRSDYKFANLELVAGLESLKLRNGSDEGMNDKALYEKAAEKIKKSVAHFEQALKFESVHNEKGDSAALMKTHMAIACHSASVILMKKAELMNEAERISVYHETIDYSKKAVLHTEELAALYQIDPKNDPQYAARKEQLAENYGAARHFYYKEAFDISLTDNLLRSDAAVLNGRAAVEHTMNDSKLAERKWGLSCSLNRRAHCYQTLAYGSIGQQKIDNAQLSINDSNESLTHVTDLERQQNIQGALARSHEIMGDGLVERDDKWNALSHFSLAMANYIKPKEHATYIARISEKIATITMPQRIMAGRSSSSSRSFS